MLIIGCQLIILHHSPNILALVTGNRLCGFCLYFVFCELCLLWRCWLDGRKGIQLVKTEWWGAGMVICLERDADLHIAQLMPLPLTISCSSKSGLVLPEWFCFSGAGLPRLSGKRPLNKRSSSSSSLCFVKSLLKWNEMYREQQKH